MRSISVLLPEAIYYKLKRMKDKKQIKSISEFVRNLLIQYLLFESKRRVVYMRETIAIEETRRAFIQKAAIVKKPRHEFKPIFGSHQREVLQQLKEALAKRRRK